MKLFTLLIGIACAKLQGIYFEMGSKVSVLAYQIDYLKPRRRIWNYEPKRLVTKRELM